MKTDGLNRKYIIVSLLILSSILMMGVGFCLGFNSESKISKLNIVDIEIWSPDMFFDWNLMICFGILLFIFACYLWRKPWTRNEQIYFFSKNQDDAGTKK
jgi:hypothetical protein